MRLKLNNKNSCSHGLFWIVVMESHPSHCLASGADRESVTSSKMMGHSKHQDVPVSVSVADKLPLSVKELIAGGVAGALAKTSVAPLERLKILYQTRRGKFQSLGVWGSLGLILREEGVRSFYRGNGASILRIVPYAGLQFMAYEQYRRWMVEFHPAAAKGPAVELFAGALAGGSAVLLTYPLDLARTLLAYQVCVFFFLLPSNLRTLEGTDMNSVAFLGDESNIKPFYCLKNHVFHLTPYPMDSHMSGYLHLSFSLFQFELVYWKTTFVQGKEARDVPSMTVLWDNYDFFFLVVLREGAYFKLPKPPFTASQISISQQCEPDRLIEQVTGQASGKVDTLIRPSSLSPVYKGIGDVLTRVYKESGTRGLYRGVGATLYGVFPYAGLKFYVYEKLKGYLSRDGEPSISGKLACGAIAGLIGQTFTYPLDVVRRQMQVQGSKGSESNGSVTNYQLKGTVSPFKGTLDGLHRIMVAQGWRQLFAGLSLNYLKLVPSVAIGFTVYDGMKTWLRVPPREKPPKE